MSLDGKNLNHPKFDRMTTTELSAVKGFLSSTESFGAVDGPGVRFVAFLQGCSLRCSYCHNPETWAMNAGQEITAGELAAQALRYKPYWKKGGGVTVSGGEALLQMDFVTAFFTLMKRQGVHTALDTSGGPFRTDEAYLAKFDALMKVTDLVILDLKEMDEAWHKALTGAGNANILAMARYLSDHDKDLWIRRVLVPGLTDFREDLESMKRFIDELSTVRRVEVLPYHRMGIPKWEKLGIPYTLGDAPTPTPEEKARAEQILGIGDT